MSQTLEKLSRDEHQWGIILAAGEGVRVRDFLARLCGGRGIKQFSAVLGNQTMLDRTRARVRQLIRADHIVVVVSEDHRAEVSQQLSDWPPENIIFQPTNRDTAAGVLLPLAHVTHRDPLATVAIFPSDHFIVDEKQFMRCVQQALWETEWFPQNLTLLGVTPDGIEEGYGWIELEESDGRYTSGVRRFWEKPPQPQAYALWQQGALWNTFVCVATAGMLWQLIREVAPDLYKDFLVIRQAIGTPEEERVVKEVYRHLRKLNFSSDICQRRPRQLRVLPVPPVGWSDWGSSDRIIATFEQLGKKDELRTRLTKGQRPQAVPRVVRPVYTPSSVGHRQAVRSYSAGALREVYRDSQRGEE